MAELEAQTALSKAKAKTKGGSRKATNVNAPTTAPGMPEELGGLDLPMPGAPGAVDALEPFELPMPS